MTKPYNWNVHKTRKTVNNSKKLSNEARNAVAFQFNLVVKQETKNKTRKSFVHNNSASQKCTIHNIVCIRLHYDSLGNLPFIIIYRYIYIYLQSTKRVPCCIISVVNIK